MSLFVCLFLSASLTPIPDVTLSIGDLSSPSSLLDILSEFIQCDKYPDDFRAFPQGRVLFTRVSALI